MAESSWQSEEPFALRWHATLPLSSADRNLEAVLP